MNANMPELRWLQKVFASLHVLWKKVALALEGLTYIISEFSLGVRLTAADCSVAAEVIRSSIKNIEHFQ